MQLDLDILQFFGGKISGEGNLYFLGESENSWSIIYPDLTGFETEVFYKIINPYDDVLIYHFYFFRNIREAILFFEFKGEFYFRNSVLFISGIKGLPFIKEYVYSRYIEKQLTLPKLHFCHSPDHFEMVALYLELLDKGITYEIIQSGRQPCLKMQYQMINVQLNFRQISKNIICYLLGINDNRFRVRNRFLTYRIINQNLTW